jgi:hypothetical protein
MLKTATIELEKTGIITKTNNAKRKRYVVLALVLLLLLGLGGHGFFTYQTVRQKIESGVNYLQQAAERVQNNDKNGLNAALIGQIRQDVTEANRQFQSARESLTGYNLLLPLISWLPGLAYDAGNLPVLLEIANDTTKAAEGILELGEVALNTFNTANPDAKIMAVANILTTAEAGQKFNQTADLLAKVTQNRAKVAQNRFSLNQTKQAITMLDQYLPVFRQAVAIGQTLPQWLPSALGSIKPANYLLILQNTDELRPTGGFISAVGLLTLTEGKISLTNFQDSYAVDNPAIKPELPPYPLAWYMNASYFLLRDANWWADFPTSARKISQLYRQHQNIEVDGVVALDSRTVSYIFEAFGAIALPAYQETLTAQNFEERLRYYYQIPGTPADGEWWLKRKEFIGVVMKALFERFSKATDADYLKLIRGLGRASEEKHLQLYFSQPVLQTQLQNLNLDRAQSREPPFDIGYQDYLMIVESNVGFNKVNPKIQRIMSYNVVSGGIGGSLIANLTITYTNQAGVRPGTPIDKCVKVAKYDTDYNSMMNGCYWNYLRIYVPEGSHLLQSFGFTAENQPRTGSEGTKTVFSSQIVVPPGETLTVQLRYLLPKTLPFIGDYRLTVQKQAGLAAYPFQLNLNLAGRKHTWNFTTENDFTFIFKKGE